MYIYLKLFFIFSLYLQKGFEHLHVLPTILILWHVIISLVLLWMTTWIYGRERFQCDVQFMLGKTISNFKILLIRFVTPALLVVAFVRSFIFILYLTNANAPLINKIFSFIFFLFIVPNNLLFGAR